MGVDWGFGFKIAGAGFGTVFIVLSILAAVIWGIGRLLMRYSKSKEEKEREESHGTSHR